jgi:hypothetical protein
MFYKAEGKIVNKFRYAEPGHGKVGQKRVFGGSIGIHLEPARELLVILNQNVENIALFDNSSAAYCGKQ